MNVGGDASDARNNTPLIRDERDKRWPNAVNRGTNFPRHGTIDDYLRRFVTTQDATNRGCGAGATQVSNARLKLSRQKSRLLPAATKRTSAKAPQVNFADK
jgi:hypothetical protein